MKNVISVASALAYAFSLHAQVTAILNKFPARSPEIEIQNDSTASLMAFAVSMASVASDSPQFVVFVDTAVDTDRLASHDLRRAMPLLPNQKYIVPVPSRLRPGQAREEFFEPPIVIAGVFADGTTTG